VIKRHFVDKQWFERYIRGAFAIIRSGSSIIRGAFAIIRGAFAIIRSGSSIYNIRGAFVIIRGAFNIISIFFSILSMYIISRLLKFGMWLCFLPLVCNDNDMLLKRFIYKKVTALCEFYIII
jgi:hypothetical protein